MVTVCIHRVAAVGVERPHLIREEFVLGVQIVVVTEPACTHYFLNKHEVRRDPMQSVAHVT